MEKKTKKESRSDVKNTPDREKTTLFCGQLTIELFCQGEQHTAYHIAQGNHDQIEKALSGEAGEGAGYRPVVHIRNGVLGATENENRNAQENGKIFAQLMRVLGVAVDGQIDEDVADAIQDTILSCYENLRSLRKNRYFKTWLIRILINKCKDVIQKNKLVTFMDQIPETPFHEEYETIECLQALEPLDSKYRLVVILYYMEEFNIREISNILDLPENTVKSRLYRGRKKSQRYMGIKLRRNVPNDDSK